MHCEDRVVNVDDEEEYALLKVNYEGEVLKAEVKTGSECSYSKLYQVKSWDILLSNMGVGRGAIGIVPPHYTGMYVSNEYTILKANSKEEAVYYTLLLRTKEILGDILADTTGMNRGRIKWNGMKEVEVPKYDESAHSLNRSVQTLEKLWEAVALHREEKKKQHKTLGDEFQLEGESARKRWLALKPPE